MDQYVLIQGTQGLYLAYGRSVDELMLAISSNTGDGLVDYWTSQEDPEVFRLVPSEHLAQVKQTGRVASYSVMNMDDIIRKQEILR